MDVDWSFEVELESPVKNKTKLVPESNSFRRVSRRMSESLREERRKGKLQPRSSRNDREDESTHLEDLHHVLNPRLIGSSPAEVRDRRGVDLDLRFGVGLDGHDRLCDEDSESSCSFLSCVLRNDGRFDPVERVLPCHLLSDDEIRLKLPSLSRTGWRGELLWCERRHVEERDRVVSKAELGRIHRPEDVERDEEGELGGLGKSASEIVHELLELVSVERRTLDIDLDANEGHSEERS